MTGTERKRAWRERQKQQEPQSSTAPEIAVAVAPRDTIGQMLTDRQKTLRALVRLRHSKAADREISAAIAIDTQRFWREIQRNRGITPLDLEALAAAPYPVAEVEAKIKAEVEAHLAQARAKRKKLSEVAS
jgi:hypothetical protein